ncbi:thioesterase family protein [Mumia sp. DW29H23]|uniref:thioesterase family protein n=1 Tax=Mumia sp. DW29H23 TaxID=3421241 RepID=UPI003D68046F
MSERTDLPDLPDLPAESFYVREDDRAFRSTAATESPWDLRAQHGGPPAALLARAIEEAVGDEPLAVAKVDVDFLGPIPQGVCEVAVTTLRPGRRVRLMEATLTSSGRPAVAARAWLVSHEDGRAPSTGAPAPAPPLPGPQPQLPMPGAPPEWGYGLAIEWRYVSGGLAGQAPRAEDGATRVWMRVRVPLVAGEEISGLERLMVVADSANGMSANLPFRDWLFIPPGLGVTLQRPPASEWVHLEAASWTQPRGTGVAHAVATDAEGLCGFVAQPLLVAPQA